VKPHWLTNSVWNLLGTGIPFAFAVVCMPLLFHRLGAERYGLLILAWAVVGYFSIFDFGLSRAITQLVARAYTDAPAESAPVVVTGAIVLVAFGMLGGALLYLGAPFTEHVSRIPAALRHETVQSIRVLGIGLPFVVLSTGLRGALEGVFDFAWLNVIRAISGIGTYLVPIMLSVFSLRLDWICAGLVVLRAAVCVGYYARCRSYFALGGTRYMVDSHVVRRLLSYGGWITVSNLVSPLMAYLDRFLVAGAISVSLAGYYSTSQEIVTKFQIIPGAILAVLFPAISRSHVTSPEQSGDIFFRGTQFVTFALLPIAAGCLLFAREGLSMWFGVDFASHAYRVAQILTIGSFINCLALNPFSFLQGIGRPDVTAKIHAVELPLYLLLLWLLMRRFGVIGVALAWSIRMSIDLALLLAATYWQSAFLRRVVLRAGRRMLAPICLLASLVYVQSLTVKAFVFFTIAGVSAWALWVEWLAGDIVLVAAGQ
jgi:O-antigen/teichoic acid export membrane protein